MFKNGDRVIHIESGKKGTFKEYEVEGWTDPREELGYCAWVVFDRIGLRKKQERLIFIKNLKKI